MGKKIKDKFDIINNEMRPKKKMETVKPTDLLLEKKTLHNVCSFVFNKVLTQQFYPEEFAQAHLALQTIKGMIENLEKDIDLLEPKPEIKEENAETKDPVQPVAESN